MGRAPGQQTDSSPVSQTSPCCVSGQWMGLRGRPDGQEWSITEKYQEAPRRCEEGPRLRAVHRPGPGPSPAASASRSASLRSLRGEQDFPKRSHAKATW